MTNGLIKHFSLLLNPCFGITFNF